MKSLPSTYNLDFQEVTPRLWESIENVASCLGMLSKIMSYLEVNENILKKPFLDFFTSTELVNMLVRKYKVPFRTAHKIVGALTRHLIANGLTLSEVKPELLKAVAKSSSGLLLDVKMEDICESIDPLKFVNSHNVRGGPAPTEVKRMMEIRKEWVTLSKSRLSDIKSKLAEAEKKLQSVVKAYLTSDKPFAKLKVAVNK